MVPFVLHYLLIKLFLTYLIQVLKFIEGDEVSVAYAKN